MTARLVILISGNGSNLQAILDACENGSLPASIAAVISNVDTAYGLVRAQNAGVQAIYFPKFASEPRQNYDSRLADVVTDLNPDFVILAGWMRLLTLAFLGKFPGRVINLHPALPGMFPGTHAIERAYKAYLQGDIDRSGVMVHVVPDEGVDDGPVLAIQEVLFQPGQSLAQFEARMHATEHRLLVNTLARVIVGE
jgi:formyltetrahydrofolate-dependent phosphoribosylglycinamide formyltransferase